MESIELGDWIPDFSINKEDICKDRTGHILVEIYNDETVQKLCCTKCGYISEGHY